MLGAVLQTQKIDMHVEDLDPSAAMIGSAVLRMGSAQGSFDLISGLTSDGLMSGLWGKL